MRNALTATAAALGLLGTSFAATAPAQARGYYGGYHGGWHGHYHGYRGDAGLAIGAGILGLAAGAALASPGYRDYYGPVYYAPPPPPRYYGYDYCRTDWRWDGYRGRYVPVRYCD